jgi:crotonobetainyl-CoA:carnitine CoA-transferase CaiB-like acyl-CoA transferase
MGDPAWCRREEYSTLERRLRNQDSLDRDLESWTRERDRYEVMHLLLAEGVSAGAVQDARDRFETDEQLRARRYFTRLRNTETGEWPAEELPLRMSVTPPNAGGELGRGAPCIGEDNVLVYGKLLGLSEADIRRGEEEGLFQ